jgi:hypothetical protein
MCCAVVGVAVACAAVQQQLLQLLEQQQPVQEGL